MEPGIIIILGEAVMKYKKKKPMKRRLLFRGVSILLVLITIKFSFELASFGVLTLKGLLVAFAGIFLLEALLLFIMNKNFKIAIKIPALILSCLIALVMTFGIYNLNLASSFLQKIVSPLISEEIYGVYVLKKSEYESIKDLNKATIGIYDSKDETLEKAIRELKTSVTFKEEKTYEELDSILRDCIDKKIDAVYLDYSIIGLIEEEYHDLFENFRSVGEIKFSTKRKVSKRYVDVTKESFLIYISGNDTYGSINMRSRSDVNILVGVNPKTKKILLVNTPRDYYVKLHSKKAMDKLTHAGIYGIEESVSTLEDLYATDIDFYVRLNFSSLVKIVNTLGGVTVESKYAFSYDGFDFNVGKNNLSGEAALAFARFRYTLPNGDISRGENQEALIEGIIDKLTSSNILTKYTELLDTLGDSISTDMSSDAITSFAKFQLKKNPKWTIETQNATGYNAYETTYSIGKTPVYVMRPDETSVTMVKEKLFMVLDKE